MQPRTPATLVAGWLRCSMVLHKAIQAAREGNVEALRALHESGCLSPTITDAQGASPIHHAARCGQLECLQFLVKEAHLPCHIRTKNGATPAHDATVTGHVRELEWLLRQGNCGIEVSAKCMKEKKHF